MGNGKNQIRPLALPKFLKSISVGQKIVIPATLGTEQIVDAKQTFPDGISSDFKNWGLDKDEKQTEATPVEVFELIKDGDYPKIFGGFSQNLDRLCLTRAQIRTFAENHRTWLRDGCGTFFLSKEDHEFFVVRVRVCGGLDAAVRRLSGAYVSNAERGHRFVLPRNWNPGVFENF